MRNSIRRRELLAILGGTTVALGQQPTFSTGARVVNVFASVRDSQGRFFADLTQADFELREDKRIQKIQYFARQTDVAVTLGMLVDTSASQTGVLDTERNAARNFLWQVLRPNQDSAFLIRFDIEVELTQDSTNSLPKLDKALDSLQIPTRRRRGRGLAGIGTLLYDSVFLAADEVLATREGRKAIILLSDGADFGSRTTLDSAIGAAPKADTSIYSIHAAAGDVVTGRSRLAQRVARGKAMKVLRQMSEETGGRYFEVTGKTPLEVVFKEIDEELRNQYSLGYVSDRPEADGEFRTIAVATKRKGLKVQARSGYYAEK